MVDIIQKPKWQEPLDKIKDRPGNPQAERQALDAMLDIREKEMADSRKAREWEKDRKKEWAENKKYWKKDQEAKAPKNPYIEAMKEIKKGGIYNTSVHPLQGYILTKLEKVEKRTAAGIILPDDKEETPNTARVIEVGEGYWIFNDHFQEPQVKEGQLVIFRKLAGMDIEVKGEKYLMLHFMDMIATVDD